MAADVLRAALLLGVLLGGFCWGVAAERFGWFPHAEVRALLARVAPGTDPLRIGHAERSGRTAVDCRTLAGGTLALMLFGQSNAANSGDVLYPATPRGLYNYSIADDRCYEAADPLLGATGTGGSVGMRLGARLLDQGVAQRVLLVPVAVAGSSIDAWAPPGELSGRAPHAVRQLAVHGIPLAAALWQQGESDHRASAGHYADQFRRVAQSLRDAGFSGRLIVSHSTRCGAVTGETVREANRSITAERGVAEMGPDFDALAGPAFRHDGCHLNERGQQAAGALWAEALARGPLPPAVLR